MATVGEESRSPGELGNLPWIWALRATPDQWLFWDAVLWDWQPQGCCRKRDSQSRSTRKICRRTQPRILREVNGFPSWFRSLKNARLFSINSSCRGGVRLSSLPDHGGAALWHSLDAQLLHQRSAMG